MTLLWIMDWRLSAEVRVAEKAKKAAMIRIDFMVDLIFWQEVVLQWKLELD